MPAISDLLNLSRAAADRATAPDFSGGTHPPEAPPEPANTPVRPSKRQKVDTAHWATFWSVTRRMVQIWVKEGLPVDDPPSMARWILSQKRASAGPRAKAEEILRNESRETGHQKDVTQDPGGTHANDEIPDIEPGEKIDLDTMSQLAFAHYRAAISRNNQSLIKFWGSEFKLLQKQKHDAELHAKKLGIEEGEILPRVEVERLMRSIAFWMIQSIDKDLQSLAPRLLNLTYEEEAWDILDRYFMRRRFLNSFAKAVVHPSSAQLPPWLVATIKDALDDYYEPDGEDEQREWDAFMAQFEERQS